MTTKEKEVKLAQIHAEVMDLTDSPLYSYRTENGYLPVIGEGSADSNIMFVGEAPGRNEAKTGRPFCGAAGKILDELLHSIDLAREDIYITNIVKDRPQQNRDPLPREIELYAPFLDRQIDIIRPAVVATLGRFSMTYIMQTMGLTDALEPIGAAHGKVFDGRAPFGSMSVVVLYHPAAAIYNQKLKSTLMTDFQILKKFIH